MFKFGQWLPDLPAFNNSGLLRAENVLPTAGGYIQAKGLSVFTGALTARSQGVFAAKDKDANISFFSGDTDDLYRLVTSTNLWENVAGATYATTPDGRWEFIQWGEKIIATNYADAIQIGTLPITTTSKFGNLTGSPPKAKTMAIVREFVVVGYTSDGSTPAPYRVQWSGQDDETAWTPSSTTLSGYQDLFGGGAIARIIGGDYGVIFQENHITRMTFIGSPLIWQFDTIESNRGTNSPQSVIKVGEIIYYLGKDGFYSFNGQSSSPLGNEKINRSFLSELDDTKLDRVTASVDYVNNLIFWGYKTKTSPTDNPDKILAYNWVTGMWTKLNVTHEILGGFISPSYTLEDLDSVQASIDDLSVSLDSAVWKGGTYSVSAFDANHKLNVFEGSDLTALLETSDVELSAGRRTYISGIRPIVDGGTVTARIGHRNNQTDAVSYTTSASVGSTGYIPFRVNNRFVRFELSIFGDFTSASGVEIMGKQRGRR